MKANELRDMRVDERTKKLEEMKEELFKMSFQHVIKEIENNGRIEKVKKDSE